MVQVYRVLPAFVLALASCSLIFQAEDDDTGGVANADGGRQASDASEGNDGAPPVSDATAVDAAIALPCEAGFRLPDTPLTAGDGFVIFYEHPSFAYTHLVLSVDGPDEASVGEAVVEDGKEPDLRWSFTVKLPSPGLYTATLSMNQGQTPVEVACEFHVTESNP